MAGRGQQIGRPPVIGIIVSALGYLGNLQLSVGSSVAEHGMKPL